MSSQTCFKKPDEVQSASQDNQQGKNEDQAPSKSVPFWLVGCKVNSSKQSVNQKSNQQNPEQPQDLNSSSAKERTPKQANEVDLLGIEEEESSNMTKTSAFVEISDQKKDMGTPQKQVQNLDEIFQDLVIPSERSTNKEKSKQNQKNENYAMNQWNSVVSTQQVIIYNAKQENTNEEEQKENTNTQWQDKWGQDNQTVENNVPQSDGNFFDMTEFKESFNKQQETNDFVQQTGLSEIKEEEPYHYGDNSVPFPEKAAKNQTRELQNENQNIEQHHFRMNNEFGQEDMNDQDNEEQKDFTDSDFDDKMNNHFMDPISEHELKEKQQNRQKQRYFSEVVKKDNSALIQQSHQGYYHEGYADENEMKDPKNGLRKVMTSMQHNQSSKDLFDTADYDMKNYRMSHNVQLSSNIPDPLDFYSHRPPTGYFSVKRCATGNFQVVDLIQEANLLKEEQKKQLKRDQFMIEFNTDPNMAVQKLEQDQKLSLQNIAEFLLKAEGIRKNTLGQYFGKDIQKNQEVLREFCQIVDFKDQTIDEALRSLMSKFRLPGESQQIDRIMCAFSESYHEQNPNTFENSDIVYILAYSIMMVHTDAHSEKIEKKDKMKRQVFIERTQSVAKSSTVTYKILGDIFDRVQAKQFECEQDAFEKAYDILLVSHADVQGDFAKLLVKDVKYFQTGNTFLKYGRQGNPKEKFVNLSQSEDKICWCDPKNKNKKREILIEDIYEITIGCDKTEVLKKNKVPKQLNNLCFSLLVIGHDNGKRSLDLKAKDEDQRNKWVRFCYQKLLNAKQQAFELKKAKFSMQEYKEEISGIWKSQIFEQFDIYWDYDINQPLNMDKYYKFKSKSKENSQNIWKNVMKKKKQQNQKFTQVGVINESAIIREHIEDLQKNKELLFIRLWKQGLPHFVRKTLYKLSIGNKLEITPQYFELIKQQADQKLFSNNHNGNHSIQQSTMLRASISESPRKKNNSVIEKLTQMNLDLAEFLEKHPTFIPNQEIIRNVLAYTLFHRQDLTYLQGMVSIAALIVNIFQNECDSFIYFINLIYGYHFKPLYGGDKTKIEFYNQFFYLSFQKEMQDLHERFVGLNLGPQNYLYGWLLSLFSDYFSDINIVYRILDNVLIEGEYYIFKAALGIIKMYEIDLRFSSFTVALKYLTEMSKNVNEEFLFDTIECIEINKYDYEKFFHDLKKSQAKSLIHEILIEL